MGCRPSKRKPTQLEMSFKAALLIQRWYRRYRAQHDIQRQYTWTIFQKMEYANEQDHLKLQNFFNDLLSNKKLISSLIDPSMASAIETVKRRSRDYKSEALLTPELDLLKATEYEAIIVPETYQGFRMEKPYHQNALEQLIESVKAKQRVHVKFVLQILHEARAMLKTLPNIRHASTSLSKKITVVGDLHGKLDDLLIIFYKAGLPDTTNPFVFNGDFVDRGFFSVEIMLILLMALITNPNAVFLNRGNHEDHVMNLRYGFIKEISNKYRQVESKKIRRLMADVFSWLPVATIIDHKVMVCHGGISDATDLKVIQSLKRSKYVSILNPPIDLESGQTLEHDHHEHEKHLEAEPQPDQNGKVTDSKAFLQVHDVDENSEATFEWKQVVDLLWSDPSQTKGCSANTFRGGGCYFGPDISSKFLKDNNLQYIIRSHECKQEGYEITHDGQVVTLFSASNYYEIGSNRGAFCRLVAPDLHPHFVQFISTRGHKRLTMKQTTTTMEEKAIKHLHEQFFAHKTDLLDAFEYYDPGNTGMIKVQDWCLAVEKVLKLGLPWRTLRKRLVRSSQINLQLVDYYTSFEEISAVDVSPTRNTPLLFETLYRQKDNLEVIFRWMDKDSSGILSMEEFQHGCILLNKHMGNLLSEEQIHDLAMSLDINKDGQIEFNEFLEAFRLAADEDSDFEENTEGNDSLEAQRSNNGQLRLKITENGGVT